MHALCLPLVRMADWQETPTGDHFGVSYVLWHVSGESTVELGRKRASANPSQHGRTVSMTKVLLGRQGIGSRGQAWYPPLCPLTARARFETLRALRRMNWEPLAAEY